MQYGNDSSSYSAAESNPHDTLCVTQINRVNVPVVAEPWRDISVKCRHPPNEKRF